MTCSAAQAYSKAADVFSFGVVLWELATWHVPWDDLGVFQVEFPPDLACFRTASQIVPVLFLRDFPLVTAIALCVDNDVAVHMQIMVSVSEKDQRPDLPEDASTLVGGSFEGWPAYTDLIQRCWTADPAQRPTFESIIATLRELLTQSTVVSRQRRLTETPSERSDPATPRTGSGGALVSLCLLNAALLAF